MTPSQLLERIEQLGIVEEKYLDKIRSQVQDPEKVVKPKAVIGYLLKKQQISKQQAVELIKPPTEDEILDVVQPVDNDYDSAALIGVDEEVVAPLNENQAPKVSHDQTMMDDGSFQEEDVEVVDVQPIESPQLVEPIAMDAYPPADPLMDPSMGMNPSGGFATQSGANPTQSGANKAVATFAGKRDNSNQFNTKWLYIGFSILGMVLLGIALFYTLLASKTPDEMLEAVNKAYIASNWGDVVKKSDMFLEKFEGHPEAPSVRAKRTHGVLRGIYAAKGYDELFGQSDELLTKLAAEEDTKISDIRTDIAVILPSAFVQVTEKAADSMVSDGSDIDIEGMKKEFEKLQGYQKVIDNPVFIANADRKKNTIANNLDTATNNMKTIEGLIKKETEYVDSLEKIKALRSEGKTDDAFQEYRRLTRLYGDIAARKSIVELMLTISEKESELVKVVKLPLTPTSEPRESEIEKTIVLMATKGEKVKSLQGEVIPFLVEGSVYGFDAGTGSIVWRYFVGFQTTQHPVEIDADRVLITDANRNDLLCVQTSTGKIIWRQEIGEGFSTPAVAEERTIVSTVGGHVIELNTTTGEFQNAAKLTQGTSSPALIGERDPFIYQVGSYSNLYAISTQSYQCEQVYSLNHEPGSVVIPPIQWTGYILIAQNGGGYCDLHVLKPNKGGLNFTRVQLLQRAVDSQVSRPFVKAGRSMLLMGDNGQIQMLDIDPTNEEAPIQMLGKFQFGEADNLQPMLSAEGSNVWVAGEGITSARIRRNRGTIEREVDEELGDELLSPARKLDDYLLHIRRRVGSGMLTAALVEAEKLQPVWSTDFGGDLAGGIFERDGKVQAISNQGDLFTIGAEAMQAGMGEAVSRASVVVENLQFSSLLALGENRMAAIGPKGKKDLLYVDGDQCELVLLSRPADRPANDAVAMNGNLLIPTTTGHVAMVRPKVGSLVGAPFQPPVSPEVEMNWLAPVVTGENQVAVALAETQGEVSKLFLLSTENSRSVQELGSLEVTAPFKNRLAYNEGTIFGVLDFPDGDLLAAFSASNPVAQTAAMELDEECTEGPWVTDAGVIVRLDTDELCCFGFDLTKKWSVDAPNVRFATDPEMAGTNLRLVYQNGDVVLLDPGSGQTVTSVKLGQPVNHHPYNVGGKILFSGIDGTIHVYNPER